MKKWDVAPKWEFNKIEAAFDARLRKEGFEILGIRMFQSKTEWKAERDGVVVEYAVYKEARKPELCWKLFMEFYNLEKAYRELLEAQHES